MKNQNKNTFIDFQGKSHDSIMHLYDQVCAELHEIGITPGDIRKLSQLDSKTTLGRTIILENGQFDIEINRLLISHEHSGIGHSEQMKLDRIAHECMIHEVLHTIKGCSNHGPCWKALARYVHLQLEYDITEHVPMDKMRLVLAADLNDK